jgi:serine/alanine adding enzyme
MMKQRSWHAYRVGYRYSILHGSPYLDRPPDGISHPGLLAFPPRTDAQHPMTPDRRSVERQVLKDPLAALLALRPDAVKQHSTALKELCRQHRLLKEQRKSLQADSRAISRKIGEAKSKGNPVDHLKAAMQQQSNQLNETTRLVDDIEKQIFSYFESEKIFSELESEASSGPRRSIHAVAADECHPVSIALLENETKEWNAYVSNHPGASLYHRAEWRELIRRTFGHKAYYFTARDKGHRNRIRGILPLIRLQSRIFGDFMVSLPYFNYGGAIGDHPVIERQLMEAANTRAAELGTTHVEYRDVIGRNGLPVRTEKVSMILQLPESVDGLWGSLGSKLRSQIKRPQRELPEVHIGGKDHLDDFYAVFSRNMRDLGTPVYSKAFFSNILDCFTQQSRIIHIRLHGKTVAAAFLLGHRDTLEIPWASTIREVNHLSINMLLYWEVLKFAVMSGYMYFDFGRSSKGSGTYRFKQQWGAHPQQLHWHYWLRTGLELPALNPDNPRFGVAIKIWQHLPLYLTNWLGPKIVGKLP